MHFFQSKKNPKICFGLFLVTYINMRNLNTCQDPPNQGQDDRVLFWAFHPILVTSFMAVLGDKVTKILRNSLFIFYFVLPILPYIIQKIKQPKWRKTKKQSFQNMWRARQSFSKIRMIISKEFQLIVTNVAEKTWNFNKIHLSKKLPEQQAWRFVPL